MVEYTEWTSIVFELAGDRADAPTVMGWAARKWRNHKEALQGASRAEARKWARRQL